MTVLSAPKIEILSQANDPKRALLNAVGDLSEIDVFNDLVLVGTFIRPEKTAGGIIRPQDMVKEDEYQGKVGLVLKVGPRVGIVWEDGDDNAENATLHTWVVYAIKDGWPVQVNGVACRFVPYKMIRARVDNPMMVF